MKRLTIFVILVASAIACQRAETPAVSGGEPQRADSKPLTIKGSDTMVILGQQFAEAYMGKYPGRVVQVNGGGSGTGIAALINGTVDLAQSSRSMKEDEKESVRKNRSADVVETPVAIDSLAVFVHESNRIKELSLDQVAAIFKGEVTNWSEVGGSNAAIILYGRESSSGTYDYFKEHVLAKADFSPRVQTLQGTAAIINAVSMDPNGIGYGGIAYAKDVRALAIRGAGAAVAPSETSVADGSYPLSRSLYFYSLSNASDRVRNFVDFARSPEAQALVSKVGYFPLATSSSEAAPATSQGK